MLTSSTAFFIMFNSLSALELLIFISSAKVFFNISTSCWMLAAFSISCSSVFTSASSDLIFISSSTFLPIKSFSVMDLICFFMCKSSSCVLPSDFFNSVSTIDFNAATSSTIFIVASFFLSSSFIWSTDFFSKRILSVVSDVSRWICNKSALRFMSTSSSRYFLAVAPVISFSNAARSSDKSNFVLVTSSLFFVWRFNISMSIFKATSSALVLLSNLLLDACATALRSMLSSSSVLPCELRSSVSMAFFKIVNSNFVLLLPARSWSSARNVSTSERNAFKSSAVRAFSSSFSNLLTFSRINCISFSNSISMESSSIEPPAALIERVFCAFMSVLVSSPLSISIWFLASVWLHCNRKASIPPTSIFKDSQSSGERDFATRAWILSNSLRRVASIWRACVSFVWISANVASSNSCFFWCSKPSNIFSFSARSNFSE